MGLYIYQLGLASCLELSYLKMWESGVWPDWYYFNPIVVFVVGGGRIGELEDGTTYCVNRAFCFGRRLPSVLQNSRGGGGGGRMEVFCQLAGGTIERT